MTEYYEKQRVVILKYFEQIIHKQITRNPEYRIVPDEYWLETCLEELFSRWKKGGYNFAKWLNNEDCQLFDSEKTLEEMILYNNRYYKTKYNVNWMYQVDNLYPNTIINTYAWICAYNDCYDSMADILHAKTVESIPDDE
jgi:hypothetical protein